MPKPTEHIVLWHPSAPPKPAVGAPCNGCGLCCLAEPCPLGMVISRKRHGTCAALRWSGAQQRYVCGVLSEPAAVLGWRSPWALALVQRLARRWIASGIGCDADVQAQDKLP